MKKIANIVTDSSVDVSKIFNVVKTMDETIHGLPTLIVDFDYVNKHYPDFDITESHLGDNMYWTFKKSQKRDNFTDDLENFINVVYYKLLKGVVYFFIDPIQNNKKTLIRIVRKIHSMNNVYSYLTDNMLYIYGDNIIFGYDLNLAKYMGLNYHKIINKVKEKSIRFITNTEVDAEYSEILLEIHNQQRYIPYLISIIG